MTKDTMRRLEERPAYDFPEFEITTAPYRVNLDQCKRPFGVLLVHGLSAAPTEMRPFASYLCKREPDWAIFCAQLKGHGGTMQEFERSKRQDWIDSCREAYRELLAHAESVLLVGLSMGAVLCCKLAAEQPAGTIPGLCLLAPVFDLPFPQNRLFTAYSLFVKYKKKNPAQAEYYERNALYSHLAYPVAQVKEFRALGKATWRVLPKLGIPTLIFAGKRDPHLSPRTIARVKQRLNTGCGQAEIVRTEWAEESGHILTVEPDAEWIFGRCHSFLRECAAKSAAASALDCRRYGSTS